MPDDALTEAADAIVRAMTDAGPVPKHHWEKVRLLAEEWPTLYEAIARLMEVRGHPPTMPLRLSKGALSQLPPDLQRKLNDSL